MRKIVIAVAAVVAAVAVGGGLWLALDDDSTATARGVCGAATYELGVEEDDGIPEAAFELQSSAPAETWVVAIEQDGAPVLEASRQTDEDGEIDLDVPLIDDVGQVVVTAALDGSEPCTITLTR